MSKRALDWNEEKYKRFLKEKRGQGEGKDYNPWLHIQDFPSKGRVSRIKGWKTQRVHHLFSDNETRCFYLFDWEDSIVDIREQYPLIDVESTMYIAEKSGITYPRDRISNFPIVLSTDFMLTVKTKDGVRYSARTVKPSSELDKKRVIEKYEIERRYWGQQNIDWGIISEQIIPKIMVENIQWFHTAYYMELLDLSENEVVELCEILKRKLVSENSSILEICKLVDQETNIKDGVALALFRYLVAHKEIRLNMTEKLDGTSSSRTIYYINNINGGRRLDIR